ncbi:SAM-dependent methyltransferase [Methylobacterium sp. RAS18]|nr:SAM-dependent methyltransferase [Methylobacterium sp. RAS18]
MTDNEIMEAIGASQGLARAALFREGEDERPEAHAVWLDGRHGSFAMSLVPPDGIRDAASWAWSSGTPHHVAVDGEDVAVTRWDAPAVHERFARRSVLADPDGFYAHLNRNRVNSDRNIVRHCLDAFRSVRTIAFNRGLEDTCALDVYLALLADLCLTRDGGPSIGRNSYASFDLPNGSVDLLRSLPAAEIENVASRFLCEGDGRGALMALPRLAVRHASGEIFQEAHFELSSRPAGPDLFSHVTPARGRKPDRGAVHFTPPYLARALAEEAVRCVEDLSGRETLTLMDITCGSAAFLIEGLRALERLGYRGHVHVVGRDVSETAVRMARFVVGIAVREWPGAGRATMDIDVADALREPLPKADVALLNPPFAVGQDIAPEIRALVRGILSSKGGHLDLSMGFISRAAAQVRPGGALAALMPAKLLEASGSDPWRQSLASRMGVSLRATFDHLRIFTHAMVRVGAVVLVAGRGEGEAIEIRAGASEESTGEALRALRRTRGQNGLTYGPGKQWTVRRERIVSQGWPATWAAGERAPVGDGGATTVTDLFDVLQGVRPGGDKKSFVRSQEEFDRLPPAERVFYRRAVTSKGIVDGRVTGYVYVFYPYADAGRAFPSEDALRAAVPETYARFLHPAKDVLVARSGKAERWWELTHRARRILERAPLLVSKYFAAPGGFALVSERGNLVEQGHAFDPRPRLENAFARAVDGTPPDIVFAYLAVLNSEAFFAAVRRFGNGMVTAGGQIDMSGRHLTRVPLMDLTTLSSDVDPLARYARNTYGRDAPGTGDCPSCAEVEDWVTEALARARPGTAFRQRSSREGMPEWATLLLDGGLHGPSEADYVEIIEHLREAGRIDAYEIDEVLGRIPIDGLSELSLITLVRTSFGFRDRLSNWTQFRDRVESELAGRGRPARKILFGLYA